MKTAVGFLIVGIITLYIISITLGMECSDEGHRGSDQVRCVKHKMFNPLDAKYRP